MAGGNRGNHRPRRLGHGTAGFARAEQCSCEPCRLAKNRYDKQLRADVARGLPSRRVDVAPIKAHVLALIRDGAGVEQVWRAAGVQASVVKRIVGSETITYVLRPTAEKLLALTPEDVLRQTRLFESWRVTRRVRALNALGHTTARIAAEMGCTEENLNKAMRRDVVQLKTLDKVREAYQRLCNQEGDSEVMRWKARRHDWAPPMAWDEGTIDEPDGRPSGVACCVKSCTRPVHRRTLCKTHHGEVAMRGGLKDPEDFRLVVMSLGQNLNDRPRLLIEIAELREMGYTTPAAVARRLGRNTDYIEKLWKAA